jgi:hypothetical protein
MPSPHTPAELRAALAELEADRANVLRLAEARGEPGLPAMRDATIAAARRALAEPGMGTLAAFVACLGREREAFGGSDDDWKLLKKSPA